MWSWYINRSYQYRRVDLFIPKSEDMAIYMFISTETKLKFLLLRPLICLLRSPKKKHIGSYIIPEKWRHVFHILYAK